MTGYQLLGRLLAAFPAVVTLSASAASIQFQDVTAAAGVEHTGESYGASWGDLDGDGYPDLFVSNHRTQPSLFLNKGNATFLDVGTQTLTWVNKRNADTHGAAWFDFNNDGSQDLFVSTGVGLDKGQPGSSMDQFLVNERGDLVNRTTEVGAVLKGGNRLPIWLDYDHDGLPDFAMAVAAPPTGETVARLNIMRQVRKGHFESVADTVGMNCTAQSYLQLLDFTGNSSTGNGRLDLLCPNGKNPDTKTEVFPQKIYNTVPTPWDDLPLSSILPAVAGGPDSVVADFNNDGLMDIFVLSGSQLRPSGAFTNAAGTTIEATLTGGNQNGKGFNFVGGGKLTVDMDWNALDPSAQNTEDPLSKIFIGASGAHPTKIPFDLDPTDPAVAGVPADNLSLTPMMRIGYDQATQRWTFIVRVRSGDDENVFSNVYFKIAATTPVSDLTNTGLSNEGAASPTLLINHGGVFTNETAAAGLGAPVQCVSATPGDFDNDGWIDLYLACRTAASNIPNILYRNRGDGTFEVVPDAGGAAGPVGLALSDGAGTADSVVTADYDVDGFLDLFVTNGFNLRPLQTGGPNKLFHNLGNGNHWLELDLVGVNSTREAVGARVVVTAGSLSETQVKGSGYHRWSQSHERMHFGLAQNDTANVTIYWPGGAKETYQNVAVDKVYRATEAGGIAPVALGDALPYPCGLPFPGAQMDQAQEAGIYLTKECGLDGRWQLYATRGRDGTTTPTYTGRFVSSSPVNFIRKSIQSRDSVNCDGDQPCVAGATSKEVDFNVTVASGTRSLAFLPVEGANTCITVDAPDDVKIFVGPLAKPVSSKQFYLDSLEACPNGTPVDPPPADDDDDNGSGGDDDGGGNNPPPVGSASGSGGGGGGGGAIDVFWLAMLTGWLIYRRYRRIVWAG